jgi:PHD/YefM family antitoxin component YafN of YafNO toxin-antitoxin module
MNVRIVNQKEFADNAADMMQEIRETGNVVEVTDGDGESLLIVPKDPQQVLNLLERIEIDRKIEEGLKDVKAGRVVPMEEVFKELRRR